MFQVAQEILRNPEDKTQVSLIFANQTEEDIILRKELDDMAAKHDNFQVILAIYQARKQSGALVSHKFVWALSICYTCQKLSLFTIIAVNACEVLASQ